MLFSTQIVEILFISEQKYMLWVLIRSFKWMPRTYASVQKIKQFAGLGITDQQKL